MTSDLDSNNIAHKRNSQNDAKTFFKRVNIPKKRLVNNKREKNYDDIKRKKIETARARLIKSESALDNMSIKTDRKFNRVKDLPIIYFVVASDTMPFLAHELKDHSHHQVSYTERAKNTLYSKQMHHMRWRSEEKKRIRDLGADMGLRLEPLRPKAVTPKEPTRYSSRLHTTPVSEKSDLSVLNYTEDLEGNQNNGIDKTVSKTSEVFESNLDNDTSLLSLELPVIETLQQTPRSCQENLNGPAPSSEGSLSTLKKVHFADGLPAITGCKIDLIQSGTESDISHDVQRLKKIGGVKAKYLTKERSSIKRSLSEITPRSRVGRSLKPMSLPKIDVMTPIYDELLLKTLQSYCLGTSRPKSACDANTLMQNMSAILHPEWEENHPDTSYTLPRSHQLGETVSDCPTKTDDSKCESEQLVNDDDNIDVGTTSVEWKTSLGQTDEKPATVQTPVNSACFQMIPPGLTKEKSQNFHTLIVQEKDI